MKRVAACLLLFAFPVGAAIPLPDTDLWAADIVIADGALALNKVRRITERVGYENQPAFVDDSMIVYSADAGEGRTDVYALDIESGERKAVASTSLSEFSPTPVPGGGLSTVRVAEDGTQQLWLLRNGADEYELLFPLLEGIGYHAWLDANRVALFMIIPGKETAELHIAHRGSGEVMIVSRDVGRSLQSWPGEPGSMAFVEPGADGERWIKRFDFAERALTPLIPVLGGSEDFAILPDGRLLMARGKEVFASQGDKWQSVAKLDQLPGIITRLAVNPTGTRLVVVVDEWRNMLRFLVLLLLPAAQAHEPEDILGIWATERAEAHVEIFRQDDRYHGRITWLKEPFYPEGDNDAGQPRRDRENENPELRERGIVGLEIVNGFRYVGKGRWIDGSIYDPENGKTYNCKMWLTRDGRLRVRGYVGVSLFGRTTEWTRVLR